MPKTVISVRLSAERLKRLDEICRARVITRSQAIDEALRIYPELLSGTAETTYDARKLPCAPVPRRTPKSASLPSERQPQSVPPLCHDHHTGNATYLRSLWVSTRNLPFRPDVLTHRKRRGY